MSDSNRAPVVPLPASRRQWVRHPASRKTVCYVHLKEGKVVGPVEVRNLSRGGIALSLDRTLDPASASAVSLFDGAAHSWSMLDVRGVYLAEDRPGNFILGATLTESLPDDRLQAFLQAG